MPDEPTGTMLPAVRTESGLEMVGAAARGLQARQEREAIIAKVLKADTDYGLVPGTDKHTLKKSGAEKVADCFNLYPDYERVGCVEDWDKPLFHYAYRCILRSRGSEVVIATGIGSCNSMEEKYRWRSSKRTCPKCGAESVIKGKEEYGGGWLCFAKKGGCGTKWKAGDQAIEGQKVGRTLNDDIYTQVNTIDKMAQKRAFVAAVLNLGFSEQFTQDMEDGAGEPEAPPVETRPIRDDIWGEAAASVRLDGETQVEAEPQAPKPRPARTLTPEPPSAGLPFWRGVISEVVKKEGEKNGKSWTRWTVRGKDGHECYTFDAKFSGVAETYLGQEVVIGYEMKGKYPMVTEIVPAEFA